MPPAEFILIIKHQIVKHDHNIIGSTTAAAKGLNNQFSFGDALALILISIVTQENWPKRLAITINELKNVQVNSWLVVLRIVEGFVTKLEPELNGWLISNISWSIEVVDFEFNLRLITLKTQG